ncbi:MULTISPECIES: tripartite tricarboxylate transporter TctB family protein [Acutalibacteraceae]|uniref:tripartite tricarboxylate transporter TctB family protein n=1 Tax=Acutalibacteraceae TaxID=3082771 RepID=UPI0013E8E53C|nr:MULTISPECIES: tripartite tricarboxylate transporter TctB family protein [Acutalibacteraceae]
MGEKTLKKDGIVGIGAVLAAAFFFYHTQEIRTPANLVEPGPTLMPIIAEALMAVCGLGMLVESLLKREEDEAYLAKDGWKRLFVAFGVMVLYAVGLQFLGFNISTPVISFVLIKMLSGGKKVPAALSAVIAVALTAALYLIFTKGFAISLPEGVLGIF